MLVTLLAPALLAAAPLAPADDIARWKGKAVDRATLEEEFGEAVPDAVERWADWADEFGYEAHVENAGRVILFLPEGDRKAAKQLKLVSKTQAAVDELLADEDGSASVPEELPPAVVVHARDEEEYRALLDRAAEVEPYLAGWVASGKQLTGFTLVKPLLSGWAANAAGRVEWDPENELVHRLTHLLLLQRHGEQPYWLLCGLSWYVEIELCKDVYCFPYRNEFVWATEHTAWPKELKRQFKEGGENFLASLAAWKRGTFDSEQSKPAWGFARFLAQHEGATSAALSELRALREEHGVRRFDDGTWEVIVGWEPSVEQQRAVFASVLGEDFEEQALGSFRGRKPSRR